jgi:uncharacterized protein (TIGR03066 family)
MGRFLAAAVVWAVVVPAVAPAAEPQLEDLLGRWQLTEAAARIPKGAILDFQKDGKLVVTAEVGGETKTFDFKYELVERRIKFAVGDRADTTDVVTLSKTELVCQDNDKAGTVARFKRLK